MPIHRAVVDAGVAREFAQADRFHALRLEPLKCRVYQRLRQISMAKGIALWRRFRSHSPAPLPRSLISQVFLSPLDGKAKLPICLQWRLWNDLYRRLAVFGG